MQAQNSRTYDKITTKDSYFSGDECQPSNEEKSKNSCKYGLTKMSNSNLLT